MEKIWHHSFYQVLHIAPEQHPMLVMEPPLNPTPSKEKVTQVLFETFNIPVLYLANQGVLSLYASGQTSGMTVESGEGMTHFVPIADGCPLHQSTFQVDIVGQDLTSYLLQLLKDNVQLLVGTGDREYIQDMKEKCCYVALDFDKEKMKTDSPSHQQKYQLPDGQEITVGQESSSAPRCSSSQNS
ncbi:actin, aortic smooth muscle [Pan paniscus]|uniref:actin, aortic smooth muscle n=1 Tax=Pan paniscus TaxID=9597 RepID=UPI0007DBC36A|nr:actin, aortic smooth muscle [Pan troglodytes]XP_054949694.1 actin, aortic smooth muscle [Pan paniscus]